MLAQEEARRLGHNFVGSEQILLGLIGEGNGIAAKCLKSFGFNLKDTRIAVEKICGRGDGSIAIEIPFTPDAKRQLAFSWDEARQLGHSFIGTENVLLGLLNLPESTGMKILGSFKMEEKNIRSSIIRALGEVAAKLAQGCDKFVVKKNRQSNCRSLNERLCCVTKKLRW